MQLRPEDARPVVTRLKKAHGHLASVIRMLEEGAECEEALTQLAAVNRAVARAGYGVVSTGFRVAIERGETDTIDIDKMEKLFLALA